MVPAAARVWLLAAVCGGAAALAELPFPRGHTGAILPLPTDQPVAGVTQWFASLAITNGLSAAKRRDLSQAAELLVLGTSLKANQLPVLISLAEVYQELGQHKKALNAWRLALRAAPADPYAWEGLATALLAEWDDASADLAKHAAVHLINGDPAPAQSLVLLEAACAAEAPAPRAVEWLYDLALSHGLRALADGNTVAAVDVLHTAAALLPERAPEIPSAMHAQLGEAQATMASLVGLLDRGVARDSRTGVLMAQHAERVMGDPYLARELFAAVLELSAPHHDKAAAAAQPLKHCLAPVEQGTAADSATKAHYCVVAALGADRLGLPLDATALAEAAADEKSPLPEPLKVRMLMLVGEKTVAAGETAIAFMTFSAAQLMHEAHQNHTAAQFDLRREETVAETSQRLMGAEWLAALGEHTAPAASLSAQPIFVVSAPHGGADVVEALLHAHAAVASVPVTRGDFLTLGIANVSDVEGMANTSRSELEAVGSTYLARRRAAVDAALTASGLSKEAPRFTDAAPRNYPLLGVALAALPHAHAVWVRSDARDSCTAALRRVSDGAALGQYATLPANLTACGRQSQVQDALMAHWAELFPGRVHSMPLATVLHSPLAAFQQLATALQLNDGPGGGGECAAAAELDTLVAAAKATHGAWRTFSPHIETIFRPLQYTPPY